jgi:hypothetical protein
MSYIALYNYPSGFIPPPPVSRSDPGIRSRADLTQAERDADTHSVVHTFNRNIPDIVIEYWESTVTLVAIPPMIIYLCGFVMLPWIWRGFSK